MSTANKIWTQNLKTLILDRNWASQCRKTSKTSQRGWQTILKHRSSLPSVAHLRTWRKFYPLLITWCDHSLFNTFFSTQARTDHQCLFSECNFFHHGISCSLTFRPWIFILFKCYFIYQSLIPGLPSLCFRDLDFGFLLKVAKVVAWFRCRRPLAGMVFSAAARRQGTCGFFTQGGVVQNERFNRSLKVGIKVSKFVNTSKLRRSQFFSR